MAMHEQVEQLYSDGRYREVIAIRNKWRRENPDEPASMLDLRAGWAHYQLGEFAAAEKTGADIVEHVRAGSNLANAAWLFMAHCAERQGNLEIAEARLRDIPRSRARDNLFVIVLIAQKRNGEEVPLRDALQIAIDAIMRVPHQVVDAHLVNNVAWLLHEARYEEGTKPMLPLLPGLVEMAIGMYETLAAPENHRAAAMFRAALIFEAAGWLEGARTLIRQSVELWRALVAREGGARFQSNLRGAEEVLQRLTQG